MNDYEKNQDPSADLTNSNVILKVDEFLNANEVFQYVA